MALKKNELDHLLIIRHRIMEQNAPAKPQKQLFPLSLFPSFPLSL